MTEPLYHMYHKDNLTKEKLLADEDFINDASGFLISRENYTAEELQDNELVYDQFMEHFRFQNVNEVTAIKDLIYAQDLDQDGKDRMGRLMQTYDRMGMDLGTKAYVDYAQGILSAPSTYASLFSFGTAKAGTLASQQALKFSLRKLLTEGRHLKNVARKAAYPVAVDTTAGAGTVYAQEKTRVETGQKDEVDMTNVGLAGGISFVTSGVLTGAGSIQGVKRDLASERILRINQKKLKARSEVVHKVRTSKLFNANNKKADLAKQFETILKESRVEKLREENKLGLKETIPEILETGKRLYKDRLLAKGEGIPLTFDEKAMQNIAAAATEMDSIIGDLPNAAKGSTERFTSRLSRALLDDVDDTLKVKLNKIMTDYNINWEDVGPLFAAEISKAGTMLGQMGKLSKSKQREFYIRKVDELNKLDDALQADGRLTNEYRKILNKETRNGHFSRTRHFINEAFVKGRVGLMTIQLATTVRNTTNGYMRNYVYALDNLGTGLINATTGSVKKLAAGSDEDLLRHAQASVELGKAQMRTAWDSAWLKDMGLGLESTTTTALFKVLGSEEFGYNKQVSKMLRELADIGEITGAETGLLKPVRFFNGLNTMSDNMFKRAIFTRELNKALRSNPLQVEGRAYNNLNDLLKKGYGNRLRTKDIALAMEEALDFTYQRGGFRGVEGNFNLMADNFIKFGSTVFGSSFVPFPRFMVNSFQFMYKHAPILGMYNWGGIRNRSTALVGKDGNPAINSFDLSPEAIAQSLSGMALLYTMYQARVKFGDEYTTAYEYKDPNSGGTFDARAMLGPFAPYALAADVIYRLKPEWHGNENVARTRVLGFRESVEAITGSFGRAGTGLYIVDGIMNEIQGGNTDVDIERGLAKFLGNYFNTFFVGAGVFTDILGSFVPEYRTLKSNADVNFWEYFFKQTTRSLPMDAVSDLGTAAGLDSENFSLYTERDRLASPTRGSGVKRYHPFFKQITGLTPREEKTFIEKEIARLQLDYVELLPKRVKGDQELSNDALQAMGEYVEREVANYIFSDEYRDEKSDIGKKHMLKSQINRFKTLARNQVLDPAGATTEEELERILQAIYMTQKYSDRKYKEQKYKEIYGDDRDLREDGAWDFMSD